MEMPANPATPHDTHDLELLASIADRDRDPQTDAAVVRMAAGCDECAALVADLRSLSLGLTSLPTTLPAPRDYRLTAKQAERLRRGRFWRLLLAPFGPGGFPGLRPAAGALTALGLVGLLATATPLALPASSGAAASAARSAFDEQASSPWLVQGPQTGVLPQSASAAPTSRQVGAVSGSNPPAPSTKTDEASNDVAANGTSSEAAPALIPGQTSLPSGAGGLRLPPLAILSMVLLLAGLGLFALRLAARRFA
jgi:hypothetical protein